MEKPRLLEAQQAQGWTHFSHAHYTQAPHPFWIRRHEGGGSLGEGQGAGTRPTATVIATQRQGTALEGAVDHIHRVSFKGGDKGQP